MTRRHFEGQYGSKVKVIDNFFGREIPIAGSPSKPICSVQHSDVTSDDGKCINDIKKRVGLASAVIGQLYKIWKIKEITIKTKVMVSSTGYVGSTIWSRVLDNEKRR